LFILESRLKEEGVTMKIATLTMNPAIDKSSAVNQVVAEWKLRGESPAYEPCNWTQMGSSLSLRLKNACTHRNHL
jgi:hypothetical protein